MQEALNQQKHIEEIALSTAAQGPVVCEVTGYVYGENSSNGTARGMVWLDAERTEKEVVNHLNENKMTGIKTYIKAIATLNFDGKVGYDVIAKVQ
jgi:hypothetical protein